MNELPLKSTDRRSINDISSDFLSLKNENLEIPSICHSIHHVLDDDYNNTNSQCGILSWRPEFLQKYRKITIFIAVMCMACIFQTALSVGIVSSQITTLEKKFSLQSSHTGMFQAFFEVGYVSAVIFVSYYGSRGCMPKWIAAGLATFACGCFIYAMPHFIASSLKSQNSFSEETCPHPNKSSSYCNQANEKYDNTRMNWFAMILFIGGQILMGSGSSPVLSLTPTYIDDHVRPDKSPAMIAALYSAGALGPMFGYAMGSASTQIRENFYQTISTSDYQQIIQPKDPRFIGAWWLGFIVLGSLALLASSVICLFPRHLTMNRKCVEMKKTFAESSALVQIPNSSSSKQGGNSSKKKSIDEPTTVETTDRVPAYAQNMKALPHHLLVLLRNVIFMLTCAGICFECFFVVGFATFAPKYLEREYHFHSTTAAITAGVIVVPPASLGIFLGGLLLNRFPLTRKRVMYLIVAANLLGCLAIIGFNFVGCDNPPLAGYNVDYFGNKSIYKSSNNYQVEFASDCNSQCGCNSGEWHPHCDPSSGISYFSPCFAGCSDGNFINGNCTCINNTNNIVLTTGQCPLQCGRNHIVFLMLLCICLVLTCLTQNPLLMITMRSVGRHERALALGMQLVIMRLFSNIPSPIVYGKMIDAACSHWNVDCENNRGDCIVTDMPLLTRNVTGITVMLKCGAILCYCALLFCLPSTDRTKEATSEHVDNEDDGNEQDDDVNNQPQSNDQCT